MKMCKLTIIGIERYNIPGSLSPAGEAAHGLLNLSPTEKSARPRNNTEPLSISKRKLELDGVSASVESINHMFTGKGRILQNAGFRSAASKYDKPKFPMLNAADEIGYYPEKEKIESKINIDLIVKIGDRLHLMFGVMYFNLYFNCALLYLIVCPFALSNICNRR